MEWDRAKALADMPSVKQVPASTSSVSYELGQKDEL